VRSVLVAALASCAEGPLKSKTRRFLTGLSCDELQFLAEFVGAHLLEETETCAGSRPELAGRIGEFQRARFGGLAPSSRDQDHKTILLLEFLCRSGLQRAPLAVRAQHV